MFLRTVITAALLVLPVSAEPNLPTSAQTPATLDTSSPLTFDVASIRENLSDRHARSHIINSNHDGRFTTINVPIGPILQFAYGIPESQIDGIPSPLNSQKFDIEARSDQSVDNKLKSLGSDEAKAAKRLMIQALLADRFKLAAHTESRQLPVYNLVIAKNGTSLKSSTKGRTYDIHNGHLSNQGAPIAVLAEQLAEELGRPVIDKTGLAGQYDIDLTWTPDNASPTASGEAGPSIFTAIQEQLGLKLEPSKGPVATLVVDHIEEPTPN